MTFIAQTIADRLILAPSQHPLSALGKDRLEIPFRKGHLEIWRQRVGTLAPDDADLFVLKFQGTGGRAERATYHPMDYWSDLSAELWSVNPPGYGGSTGRASLRTLAATGQTAYEAIAERAAGRPIVVMGNSLGSVIALHLAAQFPVAGLILRNPPPLRQLIVGAHGWWNGWVGAMLIARKVPHELCAIRNAQQVSCPALFVSSCKDRIVPVTYQEKIFRAYGGPFRLLRMPEADHATPLSLSEQREYRLHLDWLRTELLSFGESEPVEDAALATKEVMENHVPTVGGRDNSFAAPLRLASRRVPFYHGR